MTIERLLAESDSTSADAAIIRDVRSGSITVDYTAFVERAVTALETIASNSTSIKNSLETISNKQTAIEAYIKRLKELGETTGIHMIGPYEKFGLISIYKLLIEEGKILELDKVSDAKRDEAYRTLQYYFDQINKVVPKEF